MSQNLRPSEALAATIGKRPAALDETVVCSKCGLEGPPSTKIPGWCKACGISAALARWHAYQEAQAPTHVMIVELPPEPPRSEASTAPDPAPAVVEPPRFVRQARPRRERKPRPVAPLAPWERTSERLVAAILDERDEASRDALRVELLRVRYTPWKGGRA